MITGIILASGLSRRMAGQDKLLLPVNGMPLVEHVMQAADGSQLDAVILVYQNFDVAELAKKYRITSIYNPHAQQGQSASVKAGVRAAAAAAQAYMFMTGDQPGLDSQAINLLIAAWREHKSRIIAPVYGARRGSPVIFPASLRDRLLALTGDTGGRTVMNGSAELVVTVVMPDVDGGRDIDTPADYESLSQQ